jgi:hypothetical protein
LSQHDAIGFCFSKIDSSMGRVKKRTLHCRRIIRHRHSIQFVADSVAVARSAPKTATTPTPTTTNVQAAQMGLRSLQTSQQDVQRSHRQPQTQTELLQQLLLLLLALLSSSTANVTRSTIAALQTALTVVHADVSFSASASSTLSQIQTARATSSAPTITVCMET